MVDDVPADVVFCKDEHGLFALFPGIASDMDYVNMVTCYVHIGQHSSADLRCSDGWEEVTDRAEYDDLATELYRIGYIVYTVSKDRLHDADYTEARRKQVQL